MSVDSLYQRAAGAVAHQFDREADDRRPQLGELVEQLLLAGGTFLMTSFESQALITDSYRGPQDAPLSPIERQDRMIATIEAYAGSWVDRATASALS